MRAWQSGRRRRGFGEQAAEAEADDDLPEADEHGPAAQPGAAGPAHPAAAGGRGREQSEPLLDRSGRGHWTDEWASGDWAMAEDAPAARTRRPDDGRWIGRPARTAPPQSAHDGRATPARGHRQATPPRGRKAPPPDRSAPPRARPAPAWPVRRPPGRGRRPPRGGPAQHRVRPAGHRRHARPACSRGRTTARHAARRIRCGRRGARRRAGAPRQRPGGSHALFTDQTPPAVPHSAAPVAAIPPSQPPTPDTAPPERPTGGGPAHALAEPPTGPGSRSSARRWPRPSSSRRPRPAQRRRPRAAHPAPERARGRRRERQHRPATAPHPRNRATGTNPGLSSGGDQRARRPEARGDRRADPRRPRPTSRPHRRCRCSSNAGSRAWPSRAG